MEGYNGYTKVIQCAVNFIIFKQRTYHYSTIQLYVQGDKYEFIAITHGRYFTFVSCSPTQYFERELPFCRISFRLRFVCLDENITLIYIVILFSRIFISNSYCGNKKIKLYLIHCAIIRKRITIYN